MANFRLARIPREAGVAGHMQLIRDGRVEAHVQQAHFFLEFLRKGIVRICRFWKKYSSKFGFLWQLIGNICSVNILLDLVSINTEFLNRFWKKKGVQ